MTLMLDEAVTTEQPKTVAPKAGFGDKVGYFLRSLPVYILTAMLFAVALTSLAVYLDGGIKKRTVMDTRDCRIPFGDDRVIEGARRYTSTYHEALGWRAYDSSKVEEQTYIQINGQPVSIVGIDNGGESWAIHIGAGEMRNQLLAPADKYVFMVGDNRKTVTANYRDICF